MRELKAGLWHWQAPHPDWTPGERWPQEVSSYAIDDGERLLLFDPLAVPDALLALAREREPVIVLTAPWHERDAQALVERLEAAVFTPPADTAQDLIVDFGAGLSANEWLRSGVTREQVVDGLRPLLALPVEIVLPAHGAPTDRAA